jgi:flagellar biosynthetic protein FliR
MRAAAAWDFCGGEIRVRLASGRLGHGQILDAIFAELHGEGQSLAAWGIAWARLLPTVMIVPAFGLGIVPASLRWAMALALAVAIAPGIQPASAGPMAPWPALLAAEALRGVSMAVAASIALWAATVAGGVADTASRGTRLVAIDGPSGRRATPVATLLGLAAAIVFLEGGSAARLVARASHLDPFHVSAFSRVALDLAAGIAIGSSIGAPVLVAALGVDMANGIVARDRGGPSFESLFAPLRTVVVLVVTAALLDRMLEAAIVLSPGLR